MVLLDSHRVDCGDHVDTPSDLESAGPWAGRAGPVAVDHRCCTLLAGLAVYTANRLHSLHRLHGPTPLLSHVWGYLIWAVMQQFLLQIYFLLRLMRLLPGKMAPILAAAGLFSLAHLPNPVLTPVTLVWGIAACVLFLRYRNIYALGIAHGILGLCVAVIVPDSIQHHMRVGIGYYRYHPHRSQMDQMVSTDAWVMADAPTRRS